MPHGIPRGAMCVQRFDDSLNSAIHTTYRISLRSSSMPEPRDPLLKVVINYVVTDADCYCKRFVVGPEGGRAHPENKKYAKDTGEKFSRAGPAAHAVKQC